MKPRGSWCIEDSTHDMGKKEVIKKLVCFSTKPFFKEKKKIFFLFFWKKVSEKPQVGTTLEFAQHTIGHGIQQEWETHTDVLPYMVYQSFHAKRVGCKKLFSLFRCRLTILDWRALTCMVTENEARFKMFMKVQNLYWHGWGVSDRQSRSQPYWSRGIQELLGNRIKKIKSIHTRIVWPSIQSIWSVLV